MTKNNTEKSRWPVPLRALAIVLVAALFCSLVLPSVSVRRSAGERQETQAPQEQTWNPAEQYVLLADFAISEEKYQEAADYLEKALERGEGLEAEALEKYVELAPEDLSTRLSLAWIYENLNDYHRATAEYA